ncbi:selenocysteine-specific translation elongation factor [Fusobacterium sp.]|uniref:selenocysteine-specific translation elongation factor n=1 Tax=Fusobacterium sp. TaxID=68766 RepID=UPI00396CBB8C
MKNILIGMAGHIDHGKTTLIKALTGKNMDSLPEEKERGMTIDIAFTELDLGDVKTGLIDVPGHEKFIKNMSAGVSGINFVILVIACNDGIMPQTIEHFEIIKLLGVKNGIIVLTKKDMVNEKRYQEVFLQCHEYFKDTFLENNIYSVTFGNNDTYSKLKDILREKIKNLVTEDKKRFRLNIDRSFSVKGFGTVVTGTIVSGAVSVNDLLTLYPQNKNVRVKSIQNHGKDVTFLESGQRCAINLANVEKNEIQRGCVLAYPDSLYVSDKIDCLFYLLPDIKRIKNNHRVRLDIGTQEVIGRIVFLDRNFTSGDSSSLVQLKLEKPVTGSLHDIGIVRDYSPVRTIGSIKILNIPGSVKKRYDDSYNSALASFNEDNTANLVLNILKFSILDIDELSKKINENILSIIDNYISTKEIFITDKKLLHKEMLFKILNNIKIFLKNYHSENHLRPGVEKSEVKYKFFPEFSLKEFNALIELSEFKDFFKVDKDKISLKEFKIKLSKEEKAMKEVIFSIYKNGQFTPIAFKSASFSQENLPLFQEIHKYMSENSFIIHMGGDFYMLKGFLKESIKLIFKHFEKHATLDISQTREILNCNRDSAILILQKLDSLKITKQTDNVRVLIK